VLGSALLASVVDTRLPHFLEERELSMIGLGRGLMAIEEGRDREGTHLHRPKERDSIRERESLMLIRISMDRLPEAVETI
jgi:hypothetical protein